MARIAIDCDGVLANFTEAVVEVGNAMFPHLRLPQGYEPTKWDYSDAMTSREFKAISKRMMANPNFWLSLNGYSDSLGDFARFLTGQSGHDLWVCTSRGESVGMSATKQTEVWLDACGVRPIHNFLGVITVPYSEDKVDICSRLSIDWIIDDKAETIESMDRFPYMHAALLDRPWNQEGEVKWRVKSVGEFLGKIK